MRACLVLYGCLPALPFQLQYIVNAWYGYCHQFYALLQFRYKCFRLQLLFCLLQGGGGQSDKQMEQLCSLAGFFLTCWVSILLCGWGQTQRLLFVLSQHFWMCSNYQYSTVLLYRCNGWWWWLMQWIMYGLVAMCPQLSQVDHFPRIILCWRYAYMGISYHCSSGNHFVLFVHPSSLKSCLIWRGLVLSVNIYSLCYKLPHISKRSMLVTSSHF